MMINPDQDYDVTFSYLTAFITFTRWLSRLVDFLSCPSAATFVDAIAAAANCFPFSLRSPGPRAAPLAVRVMSFDLWLARVPYGCMLAAGVRITSERKSSASDGSTSYSADAGEELSARLMYLPRLASAATSVCSCCFSRCCSWLAGHSFRCWSHSPWPAST